MSVKAILTEQQKSYTKAEEDALLSDYYNKDYIDTNMAPLDTPTFVGQPKAPTAAAGTNTTQIATTAFVHDGLQRKSNENLLRNWYFVGGGTGRGVFPVNSRGQTSYTASNITYTIDGWYLRNTSAGLSLTSGGLNLLRQTANYCDLGQELNQSTLDYVVDKVVTVSWFDGTSCDYVTYTWNGTTTPLVYSQNGFNIYSGYNTPHPYNLVFQTTQTQKSLKAVKLELGDQQTLCRQENGAWVLNEIPDYEEEYYRCITSDADSTDTYANQKVSNITVQCNSVGSSSLRYYNKLIQSTHKVLDSTFSNPAAQTSDITVTTYDGYLDFSNGFASGATTNITLVLGTSGPVLSTSTTAPS